VGRRQPFGDVVWRLGRSDRAADAGDAPVTACVLDHGDQRGEAVDGLLLCPRHLRHMGDILRDIGELVIDTQRITDGGAPQEASPKTRYIKAPSGPAPGDLVIMALFDRRTATARLPDDQSEPIGNVLHTVASWLLCVADERPLTAALPSSVLAQLALLVRHGDWIAAQPFVDDFVRELADVRKSLRAAVRDRTHTRIGTCDLPVADERPCGGALLVENGSSVIRCGRCKAEWATAQEQARLRVRLG
jgi:hypothetical protein